ncbi:MAG: ribosome maturation factor RimM [Acidimicrobiales bacterium]
MLEVGRIARPHGVRGEVMVDLVTDRPERSRTGAALRTSGGRTLVVERATRHLSRPGHTRWIMRFVGVDDRADAEAVAGEMLWAAPIEDPTELWVHELVGSEVAEIDGTVRGRVVAVLENPAHDLLELDSGALVPVVFVRSCAEGRITIDPPAGLFDLGT